MNLLTIKNGTNKWNLQMNHVKYIISDSSTNYTLLQAIRLFNSKDKSENRTENNISTKIFINEKEIELKNNMFIEISEAYSLNEDKKLTTKSLMLKYLEIKLQNQEYFAVRKRPDEGLLAGLYELPNQEGFLSEKEVLFFVEEQNLVPIQIKKIEKAKHIFSHREWHMKGYLIRVDELAPKHEGPDSADWIYIEPSETREKYPIPSAFAAYAKGLNMKLGVREDDPGQ